MSQPDTYLVKVHCKFIMKMAVNSENLHNFENIHIVMGNESCDIDSSVSATVLAYLLHTHRTSKIPKDALIVPVQNVSEENFLFRTDNCYLYKEISIPMDLLVYRNQINFEELVKSKKVTTTLVDHHVLPERDRILKNTVVQIFDHRPKDAECNWDENKVELVIDEVGSCSTLIAEQVLNKDENLLCKELGYLIYATIIFDTQGLSPETKRAKELDYRIVEMLEQKFHFADPSKAVYEKIWKAHNDVSQLTPKQILVKDLKIVERIPVPGLPMLVEDFLRLEGSYEALKNLAVEHNVSLVVLIGIDTSEGVKRDVAIFTRINGEQLRDALLDIFCNCQKIKGYDFRFREVETGFEGVKCFKQDNLSLSRKQIIPIIIDAVKLSCLDR